MRKEKVDSTKEDSLESLNDIKDEPISKSDITIDEIISCIRDILKEYISSTDKVGKIKNFVDSIEI